MNTELKPENPDAFPRPDYFQKDKDGDIIDVIEYPGMSLRDYFAAKAMQALLCIDHSGADAEQIEAIWHAIPRRAFIIADAMLKERAK